MGSRRHFCLEKRSIHARNPDYWLSFIVMEAHRHDKQQYLPSSLFILVAGIQHFIREERE